MGCNGRISDGGVFRNSILSRALERNTFNIPDACIPAECETMLPYVIVADDAFPLKTYLVKPYSKRNLQREERICNYRISRARRVVENAFGILASRFRIFLSPINLSPETTTKVVMASCALHNYLRTSSSARYTPPGTTDVDTLHGSITEGNWRSVNNLPSISQQGANTYSKDAKQVRDNYCTYFNSVGKVSWQDQYI